MNIIVSLWEMLAQLLKLHQSVYEYELLIC